MVEFSPSGLAIGAVIPGNGHKVNCLEFHRDGQYVIMSTIANYVILIDTLTGSQKKKVYAKSSGVGKIAYTHHE